MAAFAAREAENEDPEEAKRQEEAAARRLAEKVKVQKARARENGGRDVYSPPPTDGGSDSGWGTTPTSPVVEKEQEHVPEVNGDEKAMSKGKEKEVEPARKFRGVPENVQLFEVFWKQVVELIKVNLQSSCKI